MIRPWARTTSEVLRTVAGNRDIRRLVGAWTLGLAADAALLVVLLVVAYREGGVLAVGLLGLVRMAAATLVNVFASRPAGVPAERFLAAIGIVRTAAAVVVAIALVVDAPLAVLFGCVAIEAGANALIRPSQAAILPALARTPDELIASNVAVTLGEGVGTFAGPLVGGLLVSSVSPAGAVVPVAAALAAGALLVARVRTPPVPASVVAGTAILGSLPIVDGLRALRSRPAAAAVIGAFGAQVLVRGVLTTLIVVIAIDLLGLGDPGVGWLTGAVGAGGLLGSVAAIALTGRRRLGRAFAVALTGWGLPIAVLGAWPSASIVLAALAIVGTSNALLDVAGFTLLQRLVPNVRRGAVFSVLEVEVGIGFALGSVLAPVLVELLGVRGALGLAGAILPITAVVVWSRIAQADDQVVLPARELGLLRGVAMFAPLPLAALESLATALRPVRGASGDRLIGEGDPGDAFYIVAEGRVAISRHDAVIGTLGPGEGFGEIALLRDVPRTASATCEGPVLAYALDRETFLAALTGSSPATSAAESLVGARLAGDAALATSARADPPAGQ
jgi:MFS family permease